MFLLPFQPENFLLKNKSHDSPLQLADFGLACAIPTIDAVITDPCGSAYYIAPEVFTKAYTRAADVWALGVNLFLLLSGTVPFGANASSEAEVYKSIQRDKLVYGPQWSTISAGARELVSGLLEKDPRKRYTIEQVLAHPWVTGESASDVALDPSLISSIVAFNAKNKLRKMALRLVASNLKAADVAKLRAMFNKIDTDGGGTISYTEMTKALADLGITDEGTIARMMESLDADGMFFECMVSNVAVRVIAFFIICRRWCTLVRRILDSCCGPPIGAAPEQHVVCFQ